MGIAHPPLSNAAETATNVPLHYLILAHTNPSQLRRLIERLDGPDVQFYIHVDLKSDLAAYTSAIPQHNVSWIADRIHCIWGDFSIVKATLLLVRAALHSTDGAGMCILLSGQDYPVKSTKHIQKFLSQHQSTVFLDMQPAGQVWSDFFLRTTYYKIQHSDEKLAYTLFNRWDVRSYLKLLLKGQLHCLANRRLWQSRKLAVLLDFYGGSQWWAMPMDVLRRIDAFVRHNEKALFAFFQDALIPDEFFFQSIVALSEIKGENPIAPPITYVRWDGKKHPQPVVFRSEDNQELLALPDAVLFARKFDAGVDETILNQLDYRCQM